MLKIEDFRFSGSSIDDFYSPPKLHTASSNKIRIASAADLSGFVKISSDKLVRVSQQDFWKLETDPETGEFFISRLADDHEGPVKG
jgi:hypothetical protein